MLLNTHRLKTYRTPQLTAALVTVSTLLAANLLAGCNKSQPSGMPLVAPKYAQNTVGFKSLLDNLPNLNDAEQQAQLRTFADSGSDNTVKQKANYVLARMLEHSGTQKDLKEAIGRFEQAANQPSLGLRCQWHITDCAQKLGDEKRVRMALEAIASKGTEKDAQAAARYALGQSCMRTGEHADAQTQFTQVLQLAPESQFAIGCNYYLAQLEIADKMSPAKAANKSSSQSKQSTNSLGPAIPPNALSRFRKYLDASPDGRFAAQIVDQLTHSQSFTPTKDDHNRIAIVYYETGNWKGALDEWRKAGNTSLWYKQSVCLLRLGKAKEGKAALQAGIKNHPNDNSVEPAAVLLCKMLNRDGAIAVWKDVLQHAPKFADLALFNLAKRSQTPAEALPYYRQIASSYPHSKYASDAGWWAAWNDIQAGNGQAAIAQLQATAAHFPESKSAPRCLFWVGKVYEKLGDKTHAKAAYQYAANLHARSYYGHRSAARLVALNGGYDPGWATNPTRKVTWTSDTAAEWSFPEPPASLAKQEGNTIELLTELKQWDECLELLPEKTGLLRAFYLAKLNLTMDAINAAYAQLSGPPSYSEGWQLAYPLLYARFIAKEAPTKKLDPYLVQALVREESRYNTRAISSSNAIGLMQLMPATAYGVAKRLGIKLTGKEDIHTPENNLRMGIDYLSYVLGRFNGNALFAVASYNGGPNAVQRWASHASSDTDVFVENIPYSETRDYVRKVFGSYWNYQDIYKSRQLADSSKR